MPIRTAARKRFNEAAASMPRNMPRCEVRCRRAEPRFNEAAASMPRNISAPKTRKVHIRTTSFNEAAASMPRKIPDHPDRYRLRPGFNEAAALMPRKMRERVGLVVTDALASMRPRH